MESRLHGPRRHQSFPVGRAALGGGFTAHVQDDRFCAQAFPENNRDPMPFPSKAWSARRIARPCGKVPAVLSIPTTTRGSRCAPTWNARTRARCH